MPRAARFHSALIAAVITVPTLAAQERGDTTVAIISGPVGARADSLLRQLSAKGFSGVALVAKHGQVVLKKGYGLANRAGGTPMTATSVVQIGSNTKDFTIVAILQLMEKGKIALSDPITRYFPSVPAEKRPITIEHLLKHQAGFDQHLGGDFEVVTRDQEIAQAMASKLLFAPGTERKYSNVGYSLLAAIIELVTGSSYDAYVRDNILTPLGLRDTGLLLPKFDPGRLARGYRDGKDMGTHLERPLAGDGPYWNLRGNGGMLSTVSDMYRFYRALMGDSPLLKSGSRDLFFHPERPAVLAGSDGTSYFFYSRNPGAGLDVFLASNSTDYPAPKAREELAAVLGIAPPQGARMVGPELSIDTGTVAVFPDTPAAQAAKRFLEAHADTSAAATRRFLAEGVIQRPEDRRTLDERAAAFNTMRANLGTLTPTRIVTSTPFEIVFRARSANEGMVTFTITVQQQPPHRIAAIRVEAQ